MSPRRLPMPRRPRPASCPGSSRPGQATREAGAHRLRHRPLHRLVRGRPHVRQLAHAGQPRDVPAQPVAHGVARVRAADDRRRDTALLGAADARLQRPGGRPAGTVVFDIELLETRANPTIAPPDVKELPADAKKTASGLAYKRAEAGHRHAQAGRLGARDRALHRLDDRRKDVRQLRRPRQADDIRARRRDCRVDRGRGR